MRPGNLPRRRDLRQATLALVEAGEDVVRVDGPLEREEPCNPARLEAGRRYLRGAAWRDGFASALYARKVLGADWREEVPDFAKDPWRLGWTAGMALRDARIRQGLPVTRPWLVVLPPWETDQEAHTRMSARRRARRRKRRTAGP